PWHVLFLFCILSINAFSIIITISLVLFILDFTYIVTIESYRISDRSFSMSSLPTRKLKHKNS
ncbi:hypothetical protein CRX65_23070, partial [Klebsiella pneumoniae]